MKRLTDIGAALVAARRSRGMTQRDLGSRVGVTQPQIARWERTAYRIVTLERVSAVADALGVDVEVLDLPVVAETRAAYGATLPGADADAVRALARTGVAPAAIAAFARSHQIERLDLFGSVLRDDFKAESDVDVLVTYEPGGTPSLFGLTDHETELSAIFRRSVDLVSRAGVEKSENPVRRREILDGSRVLYARS
jgi:predicted nucleotidyltransferase/DNA-binding XRE family transcriptional regulator